MYRIILDQPTNVHILFTENFQQNTFFQEGQTTIFLLKKIPSLAIEQRLRNKIKKEIYLIIKLYVVSIIP